MGIRMNYLGFDSSSVNDFPLNLDFLLYLCCQAWQTELSQLVLACPAWYEPSRAEILKLRPKPSRSPAQLVHCQAKQAWTGLGLLSLLSLLSSGRCSTQINDSTRVKAILCATKFLD